VTPTELMALGLHRIISMAMFHQLPQRWLWVAVRGGWRYLSAMVHGDITSDHAALQRLDVCQRCGAFETVQTGRTDLLASYCGKGVHDADGATCGCLLAVTIQGRPIAPAGKLMVATERCPRGHWQPLPNGQQGPASVGDPAGR